MTATPPRVRFIAKLTPIDQFVTGVAPEPNSWFITHPLGKPAGGTYTEVTFTDAALNGLDRDHARTPAVLEQVVREVAAELYGTAWAFIYGPEQHPDAIARFESPRREHVLVELVEVFS